MRLRPLRAAPTSPPPTLARSAPAATSAVATAPHRATTCARMLTVSAPTFNSALGTAPPRRATCPTMLGAARAAARHAARRQPMRGRHPADTCAVYKGPPHMVTRAKMEQSKIRSHSDGVCCCASRCVSLAKWSRALHAV